MPYSAERSPATCIDCMACGILNGRRCAAFLGAMFAANGGYATPAAAIDGFQAALFLGGATTEVGKHTFNHRQDLRWVDHLQVVVLLGPRHELVEPEPAAADGDEASAGR